jgi:hypothetical protein
MHKPMGNLNIITEDFSSVMLPTQVMTCPGSYSRLTLAYLPNYNSTIIQDVTACNRIEVTNVSGELIASIFNVEE